MSWPLAHPQGSLLRLYVQPAARETGAVGFHGDRLKIRVKSPPVDGEANKEVIRFLGEILEVPRAKIHIVRGESSRQKDIVVEEDSEKIAKIIKEIIFA